jgi:hypothetical protein
MRTEADLRAALLTLEIGAPTVEEMTRVIGSRRPHGHLVRTWLPQVAAAAVVVAIATTVTVLASGGHTARPQTTSGVTDPKALVNVDWELTRIESEGEAPTSGEQVLVIRANGDFQSDVTRCTSWIGVAQLSAGKAIFDGQVRDHSCPPPLNGSPQTTQAEQDRAAATESILDGTVQWSIQDRQLTITKHGVGSLIYRQGPADPPSPSDDKT